MTLRGFASEKRTICEVLREVWDLVKNSGLPNSVEDEFLELLEEAEGMAKRMIRKLVEYNKGTDPIWWEENKDYEEDLRRRLNEDSILR
jgi:hypothetical protein